jgi:hypothetical protein
MFTDSGYTDYAAEDAMQELEGASFRMQRRRNFWRRDDPWRAYYKQLMRKRVETAFSHIAAMCPRHNHAEFPRLHLKVLLFVIAFALDRAFTCNLA